jgi:hypothetical protein
MITNQITRQLAELLRDIETTKIGKMFFRVLVHLHYSPIIVGQEGLEPSSRSFHECNSSGHLFHWNHRRSRTYIIVVTNDDALPLS